MSLDDISAVDLAGTNTAVVWALWAGETTLWPAIGLVEEVKKGVFLLKTEPWLVRLVCLHQLRGLVAVVELVWGSIGIPALSDDEDVGSTTEWVGVESDGAEVDVRVVTRSLVGRTAVKVPFGKVLDLELAVLGDLGECLPSGLVFGVRGVGDEVMFWAVVANL